MVGFSYDWDVFVASSFTFFLNGNGVSVVLGRSLRFSHDDEPQRQAATRKHCGGHDLCSCVKSKFTK